LQLVLTGNAFCQNYAAIKVELEYQYWQSLKSSRAISQLIGREGQKATAYDSLIEVMKRQDSILVYMNLPQKYGTILL
jgi:hypothetical protein